MNVSQNKLQSWYKHSKNKTRMEIIKPTNLITEILYLQAYKNHGSIILEKCKTKD